MKKVFLVFVLFVIAAIFAGTLSHFTDYLLVVPLTLTIFLSLVLLSSIFRKRG